MSRVRVSIDALVLRGFPPEDRYRIALGLQRELTRLLSSHDSSRDLGGLASAALMKVPPVPVAPGAKPHSVGAQVARAIGRSLVR
jgi:hypothetical protein